MPFWLWAVQLIFLIIQPLVNFLFRLIGFGFIAVGAFFIFKGPLH